MVEIATLKQNCEEMLSKLFPQLIAKGWSLGAAESLTGGLLSATITEMPGSSQVFKGAVVSYQNSVKSDLLSVSGSRLRHYGAVDSVVVEQMAQGAIDTLSADIVVAVSGVAGPGPAEGKEAGTVWINITTPNGSLTTDYVFSGNRQEVRWQTVLQSLKLLLEIIAQES